MAMTIIAKPSNRGPLYGGKAVIFFGGHDKDVICRWQKRVVAAKNGQFDGQSGATGQPIDG